MWNVLSILILADNEDEEQDRRASKLAVNADCAGDIESLEITSGMVCFLMAHQWCGCRS
jgi:hypothetical protein